MTSPAALHAFDGELLAGERLLWSGQPTQGVRFRPNDVFLIPFSLLWGGFAIFWEFSVLTGGAPGFFGLWGIPFVLIGLYMIVGRFWVDAQARAKTYYGLTDRRVLIVSGLLSRVVRSLDLRHLPQVELRERADHSGSIRFGGPAFGMAFYDGMPFPGMAGNLPPAFDLIPDVRKVYGQLRDAQDKAARQS